MKSIVRMAAVAVAIMAGTAAFGQSREYIRQQIENQGSCKNVAITKTNGDLMIFGSKGWAAYGCPAGLIDALQSIESSCEVINDVVLTEDGKWLLLYDNNGFKWDGIPSEMEQVIRECNKNNEKVLSVSFNDDGDWILVSEDRIAASDRKIQDWLVEGLEDYGMLWTACLTSDSIVAIYSGGYIFLGDVPQDLKEALGESKLDVYRVKIAGTSWFFADKNGYYRYNM